MSTPAIEVENLYVDFDNVTAVAGTSFKIDFGHIYGMVGPNGAGKTTTLRVLATLQEPTLGDVKINGISLQDDPTEIRRCIGFMPDFPPVYDALKVWEFLDLYAAAYHLAPKERRTKCEERLEQVGLTEKTTSFVGELSRGMKQRLTLAKTLIHNPKILILDEPASGLDPLARKQLYDILGELKENGCTVLISSHILAEMDKFCTAIGIMEKGKIISSGTMKEMEEDREVLRLCVRLATSNSRTEQILKSFPKVEKVSLAKENAWEVVLRGDDHAAAHYNKHLVNSELAIAEFAHIKTSIEEIFIKSGAKDVS